MKTKCVIGALAVSACNTLVAVLLKDKSFEILFLVYIVINLLGLFVLLYWMTEPINSMRKRVEQMKEENRQVENMRSEFVANVSHELKTPLTSISGFIETLQAGAVNDPATRDRFIEIIAIETARLKRLIDDILVLSDIESRMDTSNEHFNVSDVTNEIIEILEPIASRRNISLINEVDRELYLDGSEDKFRQMVMNLAENAIKYGVDNGHVWIKSNENQYTITLAIQDDGIGIEKDDLERIAERFYRVDKSRSRKVGGTGLGLSIVKHTAALFNGELKVESTPGEGSVFSIIMKKEK